MTHFKVGDRVFSTLVGVNMCGTVIEIIEQRMGDSDPFSITRLPDIYRVEWDNGQISDGSDWTVDIVPFDPNDILKEIT